MKKHADLFPPFYQTTKHPLFVLNKKTPKLIFFYSSYLQTAVSPSLPALAILSPSLPAPRLSLSRRLLFSQPLPNLNSLNISQTSPSLPAVNSLNSLAVQLKFKFGASIEDHLEDSSWSSFN